MTHTHKTAGEFQVRDGQSSCEKCPINTKSEQPNSTTCDTCGIGEKSDRGSAKCNKCDAGEAGTGADGVCEQCKAGQYRQSKEVVNGIEKTTDATTCVNCPIGRYLSDKGQASW